MTTLTCNGTACLAALSSSSSSSSAAAALPYLGIKGAQPRLRRDQQKVRRHQIYASQPPPVVEGAPRESPPKIEKSLNKVEVLDLEGNSVALTDLWKARRVVVGFTRHFGCVLCMKRANLLASRKAEIDAANTSLIIVGPGKVEQAQVFAKNTSFPGEVYADPSFSTHEAFDFVSGIGTTFSPKAGLRVISAYLEGFRQDWKLSSDKDTVSKGGWKQGGVLVAGPGKENIIYLFKVVNDIYPASCGLKLSMAGLCFWDIFLKDEQAGDEPNMDDVVAACRKA